MIKNLSFRWSEETFGVFHEFLEWVVRRWNRIIAKKIGWMTESQSPSAPRVEFLGFQHKRFLNAWAAKELSDRMTNPEPAQMEK